MTWRLTIRLVFAFLILLIKIKVQAGEFESSIGLDGTTYPLPAAEFSGEIGYDWAFWKAGSKPPEDPDAYLYGYLHPYVGGATSVDYQQVNAGFEVYPISFLNFGVGTSWQRNSDRYQGFDCQTYQCEGTLSNFFFEQTLEFEWKRFSGDIGYHRDQWNVSATNKGRTVDPTTGLLLAHRERQEKISADLLWEWKNRWEIFVAGTYINGLDAGGVSKQALTGVSYTRGHLVVTGGGGALTSQLKPLAPVFLVDLRWYFEPGLGHKDLLEVVPTTSKLR